MKLLNLKKTLLSLVFFFSFSSFAKTGYVNVLEAMDNTTQGKNVKKQLEAFAKKAEKELQAQKVQLQKEEAKLKKEVALLSPEARNEKIAAFQAKVVEFSKSQEEKQLELKRKQDELVNPIEKRLTSVIGDVASKNKYTVVENIGTNVVWVEPSLDLTKKVYQKYNKKFKK